MELSSSKKLNKFFYTLVGIHEPLLSAQAKKITHTNFLYYRKWNFLPPRL